MKIKKAIALVAVLFLTLPAMAQTDGFSKNALKYSISANLHEGPQTISGGGMSIVLGYQRDLWKDRLRFVPSLMLGVSDSRVVTDTRKQKFSTLQLQIGLQFDLIRYKALSLVLAGGGMINRSQGLVANYSPIRGTPPPSNYVNEFQYGVTVGAGLRFSPQSTRIAIELIPVTISMGQDGYRTQSFSIGMDVKLR